MSTPRAGRGVPPLVWPDEEPGVVSDLVDIVV